MDYSKREIAELCGVTTQALDKKLRKTGLIQQCHKVSNRLLIPETVATKLTTIYRVSLKPVSQPDETVATKLTTNETKLTTDETMLEVVQELRKQLEVKDEQIATLGKALEAAQETAKAAQTLHAADRKEDLLLESTEQKAARKLTLRERLTGRIGD